jgi:hypothetical protein
MKEYKRTTITREGKEMLRELAKRQGGGQCATLIRALDHQFAESRQADALAAPKIRYDHAGRPRVELGIFTPARGLIKPRFAPDEAKRLSHTMLKALETGRMLNVPRCQEVCVTPVLGGLKIQGRNFGAFLPEALARAASRSLREAAYRSDAYL